MPGLRTLIAALIVGGSLVFLALWIRERKGDAGATSSVAAQEDLQTGPQDSTDLEASALPDRGRASFAETPPATRPRSAPTSGGSVSGRLLDPSETPILGNWSVMLSLVDGFGHRHYSDPSVTGRYEIRGLPVGRYTLVAEAEGYLRFEEKLDLAADRPDIWKDITIVPQPRIRVRVTTPDGRSLKEALAAASLEGRLWSLMPVATREPPGERMEEVQGSANNRFGVGSFRNDGPYAADLEREHLGVLLLERELPVHVSLVHYQHVLHTVEVHPGEEEARFVLSVEDLNASLATLRFRLEDEQTGRGISNAAVVLRGMAATNLKLGPDGTVATQGFPPGQYRLLVSSRTHSLLTLSFVAKPGINDLGVLRLEEPLRMIVRVVDEKGAPRRATFFLRVLDPETRRVVDPEEELMHEHEESGVLELNLGRKLYCLQVAPFRPQFAQFEDPGVDWTWVSDNVVLDTRSGAIADREVVLRRPSSLVLRTDDPDPQAWTVQIYDEQDLWVKGSRLRDRLPEPVELAPETYRVAVCELDGRELSSRYVTLGKEPVVLELSR